MSQCNKCKEPYFMPYACCRCDPNKVETICYSDWLIITERLLEEGSVIGWEAKERLVWEEVRDENHSP